MRKTLKNPLRRLAGVGGYLALLSRRRLYSCRFWQWFPTRISELPIVRIGALAALFLLAPGRLSAADAARPNIVFVFAEDITPDFGAYGDPYAVTPTIDRLAADGVLFEHCNVTSAVCSPSRSSMATGMYQTTIGGHPHRGGRGDEGDPAFFTRYLRQAGYHVDYHGKLDANRANTDEAFDSEQRTEPDLARLHEIDSPFFIFYNVFATHQARSWRLRRHYSEGYVPDEALPEAEDFEIPPYQADTPGTREQWQSYYSAITALDERIADLRRALDAQGLADNTIIILSSDHGHGLARGKRTPYNSGVRVPMIAFVPEPFRHENMPPPGTVSQRLVSLVDLAPTVLHLAGVKIPEHMHGLPFFGSAADAQRHPHLFAAVDINGELPEIRRTLFDGRYRYVRNFLPHMPRVLIVRYDFGGASQRDLVEGWRWRTLQPEADALFDQPRVMEELYDTREDPHEVRNLAADPEHRDRLLSMRSALKEFVTGQSGWTGGLYDQGLFDDGRRPGRPRPARLDQRHSLERMNQIWSWMAWANSTAPGSHPRDPEAIRPRLHGTRDQTELYWAAVGLVFAPGLGDGEADALAAIIRPDHGDRDTDELLAQVFAARALANHGRGDVDAAVARLVDILGRKWFGTRWALFRAAQALEDMAPMAAAHLDKLTALSEGSSGANEAAMLTALEANQNWKPAEFFSTQLKTKIEWRGAEDPGGTPADILNHQLARLTWDGAGRVLDGSVDGLHYPEADMSRPPAGLGLDPRRPVTADAEVVQIAYQARPGHLYRLQRRNERGQWVNHGPAVRGVDGLIHRFAPAGAELRLLQQPPEAKRLLDE